MLGIRRRFFVSFAIMASMMLAACGNTPASSTSTQATTGAQAGATAAPQSGTTEAPAAAAPTAFAGAVGGTSGGRTIRMGVWASPEELKLFEEWVKPFTKKTNIDVKIEYVDWTTYWTKLPSQFSAGNAPDVIEMSNYTQQFGPQGVLADLNPYIQESKLNLDDYVQVPFEKFTQEGKLYAFPMGVTIQMLAYNKDIFDKAGEKYPTKDWTWDDLLRVATKMTLDKNGKHPNDAGFDPTNVTQWGIEMALDEESGWAPLVFQNGGEYWNKDYTAPNFTDPKVVEAFQFLSDLVNKYHVAPSPSQSQKFGGSPFTAGQAAMSRQGSYILTPYKDNITNFKWDVTVPPKGKQQGVFVDGIGWSMNAASKDKDGAWQLIQYFLTDGQEYMGKMHWQVPLLKSAFSAYATPPPDHIADLQEEFNYGHRWAAYKNATQVDDIVGNITTQLFDGKLSAKDAMEQIQSQVAPLVK